MILLGIIPSHRIATWLLSNIDNLLDHVGLRGDTTAQEVIYFVIVLAASFGLGWLVRRVVLWIVQLAVRYGKTTMGNELISRHVLTRCSHIITPLVFLCLIPFAFTEETALQVFIERLAVSYFFVTVAVGLNAILAFVFDRFIARENTKNLPWRGTLNVARGLVWILTTIAVVSVMLHKSPAVLLTGLTAFAAALMLIFKDSILGFVAGIQMSQNDMVRVGDWIVVHNTEADGVVQDVSLTTVKVRNWDNTIVMVPPYTLVSTSFQNYRGMYESGVRRITASVFIDPSTVRTIDSDEVTAIVKQLPALETFVSALAAAKTDYRDGSDHREVNGTIDTNLGLLRAYAISYLDSDPGISAQQQVMVRLLQQTGDGIPLQMYCFTATTVWGEYESIQSRVVEHLLSVAPIFGLRIYSADRLEVQEHSQSDAAETTPTAGVATKTA